MPWQILYDTRSAHTKNGNNLYSNTFNEFNSTNSYKQGRLDSTGVGTSTVNYHESEGAITLSSSNTRVHNNDGNVVKSITGNGISGSLWFKLINEHSTYSSSGVTLVSYGTPHFSNHTGFRLQITNNTIRLNFGVGKIQPSSNYSLTRDKWYHVYYSFKPQQIITLSNTKLWINGSLIGLSGTSLTNVTQYSANHYIGSSSLDSATQVYIGMVAHYNSHYEQQFHSPNDNYIGQFASPTEMYNWGPPQQKLVVGGDAFIENRLSIGGTHSPEYPLDVDGDINCTGTLSKGSGSFKIDHPLPSMSNTHCLYHSFIEGPQADLIYRGKVDLENGGASINLDTVSKMTSGTFEALNRNVQCFTSNESDWDAVKGSVSGNTLTISCQNASSTANVSWLVIGERKDKHMYDTSWTDDDGFVIPEQLK